MPNVVIKDRMGRAITYDNIDTVALQTPEGAAAEFGEVVHVIECTQTEYDEMEGHDGHTFYAITGN